MSRCPWPVQLAWQRVVALVSQWGSFHRTLPLQQNQHHGPLPLTVTSSCGAQLPGSNGRTHTLDCTTITHVHHLLGNLAAAKRGWLMAPDRFVPMATLGSGWTALCCLADSTSLAAATQLPHPQGSAQWSAPLGTARTMHLHISALGPHCQLLLQPRPHLSCDGGTLHSCRT
jgi:hypothetical protein